MAYKVQRDPSYATPQLSQVTCQKVSLSSQEMCRPGICFFPNFDFFVDFEVESSFDFDFDKGWTRSNIESIRGSVCSIHLLTLGNFMHAIS